MERMDNWEAEMTEAVEKMGITLPQPAWTAIKAAAVLALGILILWIGRKLIRRFLKGKAGRAQSRTLATLLSSLFNYCMYFIIAATVLSVCGVNVTSLLTVAGVGGVAIGLGAQTFIKDVIGGVFLWLEGNLSVGDVVTLGEWSGTVESVALRTTVIRSISGQLIAVPNGEIRTVVNDSRDQRKAVVDVRCPYDAAPEAVRASLQKAADAAEKQVSGLTGPVELLGMTALEPGGAIWRLMVPCLNGENWRVEREVREICLSQLHQDGVKLPASYFVGGNA